LQERFNALQIEASNLTKEKNIMASQIDDLHRRLSSRLGESKSDDDVRELREQIVKLKDELEKKFNNSDQYQKMKTMMLSKSDKIRELK
jgi:50S ribosomal subunit-associated GTPase HflX